MTLSALQAHHIEKALIARNTLEAVRLYNDALDCGLAHAKTEVDKIFELLRVQKPAYFRREYVEVYTPEETFTIHWEVIGAITLIAIAMYHFFAE